MKKMIAAVVLVCFFTTGCTGSFNLTRKLYNAHRAQEKWVDEFLFLVAGVLLPVYGITIFADAVIFNSLEFWTGDNPITTVKSDEDFIRYVKAGDAEGKMTYNAETNEITVVSQNKYGEEMTVVLERVRDGVRVKNEAGELMYQSRVQENGEILVYDAKGKLVRKLSQNELTKLKEKMSE